MRLQLVAGEAFEARLLLCCFVRICTIFSRISDLVYNDVYGGEMRTNVVLDDELIVPIRCTQNPSMGEEWRRGWHPEIYRPAQRQRALANMVRDHGLGARAL